MGAIDADVANAQRQIQAGLADLVTTAKQETSRIVSARRGSWSGVVRVVQDELLPRIVGNPPPAEAWAANIIGYAENVSTILSRKDATGQPFYARQPQEAARLLITAKKDLGALIKEFSDEVKAGDFGAIVDIIVDRAVGWLVILADKMGKAFAKAALEEPLGGAMLIVGGVLAAVVWWKFFGPGLALRGASHGRD
jgi:hypothetical protein